MAKTNRALTKAQRFERLGVVVQTRGVQARSGVMVHADKKAISARKEMQKAMREG